MDSNFRTQNQFLASIWLWVFVLIYFIVPINGWSQTQSDAKKNRIYRFEGSEIEGEREKPKDLYILPWQQTTLLEDSDFEFEFLKNQSLSKDRYQLQKEFNYHKQVGK